MTLKARESAEAAGFARAHAATQAANLLCYDEVQQRIRELQEPRLRAADITAQRVLMELARVSFADIRTAFDDRGRLLPTHMMSDDAAAAVTSIQLETRYERDGYDVDPVTGDKTPRFIEVRTTRVKRADKVAALNILAKHFKLVGDEGDGVNALASALADRLKGARRRVPLVEEVPHESQHERINAPTDHAEHADAGNPIS
jgi:phage terminase small subunit